MATSGTFTFSLTIAEIIDEAFERCGKDPAKLEFQAMNSAVRSFNLMFADWANKGFHQWAIESYTQTLTEDDVDYNMPSGGIDVVSMVLRRDGIDVPMLRISREDYQAIADKTIDGKPSQYFVDRRINTPIIYLWNAPENSTDQIRYYYIRRLEDAGDLSNTPDTPYRWTEAVCSGLAAKLAVKFAPDKQEYLKVEALQAFNDAKYEDRDRGSTYIMANYDRNNRM